jgi:hypothetical protein
MTKHIDFSTRELSKTRNLTNLETLEDHRSLFPGTRHTMGSRRSVDDLWAIKCLKHNDFNYRLKLMVPLAGQQQII